MLVGYSVKLAMVLLLYIYMYRSNVARDAAGSEADADREEDREAIENGMLDMTEIDNHGFRYIL
jgi:uncharacterized ion transporter superfamily protein YfcC